jgi:NACHT domain
MKIQLTYILLVSYDGIKKWISGGRFSKINPQPDFERHISSRHTGTAEWIFDDPIFQKWHSSGECSSLWLNAAPGSGKSVLAASIIEQLAQAGKKDYNNVIYFFCRFDEPDKCKAISAMKSLAFQAMKLTKYIPDELSEIFQEEFSAEDCFITDTLIAERVLGSILKHIPYVTVIIDGLDECSESLLVDSLSRLVDQKGPGITKWMFTSRDDPLIRKRFEASTYNVLNVPKDIVQNDIRKFLEDNSDLLCGTCDQLDRIANSSQGNFLMIRLTIDPFRNEELTCAEEFEAAMKGIRPELSRCWERSLRRLSERSGPIQKLAQ